ncbi:hypothetical protein [Paenarthrobacter sp. A20]|uniref:hypothetical protein n=1 Tax=Paenarthrobacter sp. A20 TaxID=2817891 RepID=UPI00209DEAB7|nr:hypothetical protein [Paenarthrobacter sp. A20]MCP1412900.1 hypothetical protein [Paenarthrobacter sp. A20]
MTAHSFSRMPIFMVGVLVLLSGGVAGCDSSTQANELKPAMERFPTPLDLATARASCLQGKGWDSKVLEEDATIATTVTEVQQRKFEEDDAACFAELGVDPNREPTTAEYDVLYSQYVEGKRCLEEAKHFISSPPSRQVFQETYLTDPWIPWTEVPALDRDLAMKECPMPPPIY